MAASYERKVSALKSLSNTSVRFAHLLLLSASVQVLVLLCCSSLVPHACLCASSEHSVESSGRCAGEQ